MVDGSPSGPTVLKPVFGIFAVLGWLLLMGLHVVWRATFGWVFTTLASLIDVGIPIPHFHDPHPFHGAAEWLRSLDRNVDNALVGAANDLEHVAVWLFSRVGHFFGRIGDTIAAVALSVEHKFGRLIHVTIPRLIRDALRFVWRELRALGRYARKMIPKLARQLFRFSKWAAHEIAKGARHVGFLWKWTKAVIKLHWRVIKALGKRAGALEHALLPKGFRKLFIGALGGLGLLWLATDAVRSLGLWLSRTPVEDVEEWVRDATEAVNFCKLAEFQYDVAVHVVEPFLQRFVSVQEWYCTMPGDTLPSATEAKPGYFGAWEPSATPKLNTPLVNKRLAPDLPLPRSEV